MCSRPPRSILVNGCPVGELPGLAGRQREKEPWLPPPSTIGPRCGCSGRRCDCCSPSLSPSDFSPPRSPSAGPVLPRTRCGLQFRCPPWPRQRPPTPARSAGCADRRRGTVLVRHTRAVLTQPRLSSFVGRAAELAAIDGLLDAMGDGVARVILVAGEAGMGKSRLVGELRQRAAAAGALVATGRTPVE